MCSRILLVISEMRGPLRACLRTGLSRNMQKLSALEGYKIVCLRCISKRALRTYLSLSLSLGFPLVSNVCVAFHVVASTTSPLVKEVCVSCEYFALATLIFTFAADSVRGVCITTAVFIFYQPCILWPCLYEGQDGMYSGDFFSQANG
jgi:hypothetical protein